MRSCSDLYVDCTTETYSYSESQGILIMFQNFMKANLLYRDWLQSRFGKKCVRKN
jgi:hypothetical protein